MSSPNAQDIQAALARLNDDELLQRVSQRMLTDEAHALGLQEIKARGLSAPRLASSDETVGDEDALYLGDLVMLKRHLEPTEAHMLAGLLNSMGIVAIAGDTELVQANQLWSIALGGANVRVPSSQHEEALAIFEAYARGEFTLHDDDATP